MCHPDQAQTLPFYKVQQEEWKELNEMCLKEHLVYASNDPPVLPKGLDAWGEETGVT